MTEVSSSMTLGYLNTAPVCSSICYIDGDEGILRYISYPIEELAENSTFLDDPDTKIMRPEQVYFGEWLWSDHNATRGKQEAVRTVCSVMLWWK